MVIRVFGLHCCASFCSAALWMSYKYTYIPSRSSVPPMLPCPRPTPLGHHRTRAELPVLHGSLLLAMYLTHGGVYVAPLFSRFIPHSSLPVSACSLLLLIWFCFVNQFICTVFLDSTCVTILYFSFWLKSLCMIDSKSISLEMTQVSIFYAGQCYSSCPPLSPCSRLLCLLLCSCPNKFTCTIFLDPIYVLLYDVCFPAVLLCGALVHARLLPMAWVHSVSWFRGIPLCTCHALFVQRLLPSPGCCK